MIQKITQEMELAPLPQGFLEVASDCSSKTLMIIGYHQLDTLKSPLFQISEYPGPGFFGFGIGHIY